MPLYFIHLPVPFVLVSGDEFVGAVLLNHLPVIGVPDLFGVHHLFHLQQLLSPSRLAQSFYMQFVEGHSHMVDVSLSTAQVFNFFVCSTVYSNIYTIDDNEMLKNFNLFLSLSSSNHCHMNYLLMHD